MTAPTYRPGTNVLAPTAGPIGLRFTQSGPCIIDAASAPSGYERGRVEACRAFGLMWVRFTDETGAYYRMVHESEVQEIRQ